MTTTFSILIPTVPSRVRTFYPYILEEVVSQIGDRKNVEVLALLDNKKMSVGEKRNRLVDMAQGEYLAFVDDDDRISPLYVEVILEAIKNNPGVDVITFDHLLHHLQLGRNITLRHDKDITKCKHINDTEWRGHLAHTHVWRRNLLEGVKFIDKNFGEDMKWGLEMSGKAESVHKISGVLYFYDFNPKTSETNKCDFRF